MHLWGDWRFFSAQPWTRLRHKKSYKKSRAIVPEPEMWVARWTSGGVLLDAGGRLLRGDLREPFDPGADLAVAGAFGEHRAPEFGGLDRVAAFLGQHGEIAPGEMPVDAHVQAGELFGTPQSQDSPPARFGFGRFAPLSMHHRLAEQELGVLVVEAEPLGAGPQRRG